LIGGGLVAGTRLLQLALSVLFVILPVLTVFLSKQRINPFVDHARTSPGYLLYIGFFSSLILIALTVLLLVTIIGIPFALIIVVLVVIAFVIGMAALSILIGERIQGIIGQSDWLIALTGSILLVSIMNVPFIGVILFLGVLLFSNGFMTLWLLEKIRRKPVVKS
jgi:O-antigen/teichoic acid export membrane protein